MSSAKNNNPELPRKLSIQDLAFGIGRKVTDEEWELHLKDTAGEEEIYYSEEQVAEYISKQLTKQREKSKAKC